MKEAHQEIWDNWFDEKYMYFLVFEYINEEMKLVLHWIEK